MQEHILNATQLKVGQVYFIEKALTYFDIPKTKDSTDKNDILRQNELIKFGILSGDLPDSFNFTLGVGTTMPLGSVECYGYKIRHDNNLDVDVYEPVTLGALLNDTTGTMEASVLYLLPS